MENENPQTAPTENSNLQTSPVGNPHKKKVLLITIGGIISVLLIASSAFVVAYKKQTKEVACTLEAKLCPDGSSVGRSGPKCEFSPCPTQSEAKKTFEDTFFGFSFEYPHNYRLETCGDNRPCLSIYPPEQDLKDKYESYIVAFEIDDLVSDNEQVKTLEERAELTARSKLPGVGLASEEQAPVISREYLALPSSSTKAYKFVQLVKHEGIYGQQQMNTYYAYFFPKPINHLDLNNEMRTYYGIIFLAERTRAIDDLKSILSTFKFIN